MPSITDDVLISQRAVRVAHDRREPDGSWRLVALGPGDALAVAVLGVRIESDRAYHKVALTRDAPASR